MAATGLCHTDLSCRDQLLPTPLPTVLCHEGAGVLEKVRDGVKNVKIGDHVILSFASCGSCPACLFGRPSGYEHFGPLNLGGKMHDGSCRLHQENGEI